MNEEEPNPISSGPGSAYIPPLSGEDPVDSNSGYSPFESGDRVIELTRSAKSAVFWLASTTALWQVISWAVTLVTARILDPEDYGLVALAETVTPYLALVSSLNLATWLIQERQLEERTIQSIFSLNVILGVSMTTVAYLAAPSIAEFYHRPELVAPFRVISLIFLFKAPGVIPDALLRKELRFRSIALMNLCVGVSRVLLQLALALLGFGYWSLVFGILYRDTANTAWLVAARGIPRRLSWDGAALRRAVKFGLPATAATVLWVIFSTADNVVVGRLFGVEILGFYTMAFFLTDLPMSKLNIIVRPVFFPFLSRLRDSLPALRYYYLLVVKALNMITFPLLAGLALVAPEAIHVVLGEKWVPMTQALMVLAIVGLFRSFGDNLGLLLLALGRPTSTLKINTISVLALPACFYLFGLRFGIQGVYLAWLTVFPIVALYSVKFITEPSGIEPRTYLLNLASPLVGISTMAIAVFLCRTLTAELSPLPQLILNITLGAAVYSAVIWFGFRQDRRDVLALIRGVRRDAGAAEAAVCPAES